MNIAREQSMRTFEDLYSEPPPYSSRPPSTHATVCNVDGRDAPPENLPSIGELNFQPSPLEIPTPAQCIAHLKLLHAFAKLRHEIGNHEGLFGVGIEANEVEKASRDDDKAAATDEASFGERIRDKRWSIFVTKAVARFEKWWDLLSGASTWCGPIRTNNFETDGDSRYIGKFRTITQFGSIYDIQSRGFRCLVMDTRTVKISVCPR